MGRRMQDQNPTTFTRVVILIALYFVGGLIGNDTTSGLKLHHSLASCSGGL